MNDLSPAVPAAIVLPTPAIAATWTTEHAARLAYIYSRAELRAAWAHVPRGARRASFPRRGKAMAADVAGRDARLLGEQRPHCAAMQAAAQRVLEAGTPTWWAGVRVDVETPCPLRPPASPGHRWLAANPYCRYCAQLMGHPDPVDRVVLIRAVRQSVARHYGLSHQQVGAAIHALADAIDAHRGLAPAPRDPQARAADLPSAPAPRRQRPASGCRHVSSWKDPVCRSCGAVVTEVGRVSRRVLAGEVLEHVARHYGLSQSQVEGAVRDLARLIDAHRGIDADHQHPGSFTIGHGELMDRR